MAIRINFQDRVDECSLRAATARNDEAREVWAKMEEYWRTRLCGVEAPLIPNQQPAKEPGWPQSKRDRVR